MTGKFSVWDGQQRLIADALRPGGIALADARRDGLAALTNGGIACSMV